MYFSYNLGGKAAKSSWKGAWIQRIACWLAKSSLYQTVQIGCNEVLTISNGGFFSIPSKHGDSIRCIQLDLLGDRARPYLELQDT